MPSGTFQNARLRHRRLHVRHLCLHRHVLGLEGGNLGQKLCPGEVLGVGSL